MTKLIADNVDVELLKAQYRSLDSFIQRELDSTRPDQNLIDSIEGILNMIDSMLETLDNIK